ncbi:MAG: P-loop NTPase [Planctomycetes bacterium]|nr:P-loop NTPase [Planctomycetota bacterium]
MAPEHTCGSGCGGHQNEPSTGTGQNAAAQELEELQLAQRLSQIKHKILVMSGKGGVGKSMVAVNLAAALARSGKQVGLLDVDIHGPSVPKLLSLNGQRIGVEEEGIVPVPYNDNLKAMSIGFLLRQEDDALIWRGPMKIGVIKQFLKDVDWGQLDYLVIDLPPGTGDEPLSICQMIEDADGAIVVTTPQELALIDVRKCISFCRQLNLKVLGVVENMSGFACPHCQKTSDIFKSGGGEKMAQDMGVPFMGRIPIDPAVTQAADDGIPFVIEYTDSATTKAFENILPTILELKKKQPTNPIPSEISAPPSCAQRSNTMRIALPVAEGKLAMHFGHCAQFALIDCDLENKKVIQRELVDAPPHEPGLLPAWLAERNVNIIIAGGMGQRAHDLFTEKNIKVIIGAPAESVEQIVTSYLQGALQTGENICDH